MSITLQHLTITLDLGDRLDWSDEYAWSPVQQATEYSTTGALLVDVGTKLAGRPITLAGDQTAAWLSRDVCDTLTAWAALAGASFTLTLRGLPHTVMFDHAQKGFEAQPIWRLADGEVTPELLYLPTFRFLEI